MERIVRATGRVGLGLFTAGGIAQYCLYDGNINMTWCEWD
jgi:hypothetical protein